MKEQLPEDRPAQQPPADKAQAQAAGGAAARHPASKSSRRRRRRRKAAARRAAQQTPAPAAGQPAAQPEETPGSQPGGEAARTSATDAPTEVVSPVIRPVPPPETPPAWPVENAPEAGDEQPPQAPPAGPDARPEPEQLPDGVAAPPETPEPAVEPNLSGETEPAMEPDLSGETEPAMEPDAAELARRAEISRTAQMSIQQILEAAAAQEAAQQAGTPAAADDDSEPEEADEPEDTTLAGRARAWGLQALAGVLKWLLLVAVVIALIAGIGLAWLYNRATPDAIPSFAVSFSGQTLEAAAYDWQVPVVGNQIKRTYQDTLQEEPVPLTGTVDSAKPSLTVSPSGYETVITIWDNQQNEVFSGSLAMFNRFTFDHNGDYTAELTVRRAQSASQTAQVTGSQTYRFAFTVAIRPDIRLSNPNVKQGQIVAVLVTGTQDDAAPTLQSTLGSAEFVRSQDGWVAYLPIPADQPTGGYTVTVQADGYTEELNMTVHQGAFGFRDVASNSQRVSPYIGPEDTPAEVSALLNVADPEIHWASSGFVQPLLRSVDVLLPYGAPEYVGRNSRERLADIDNGTGRIAENTVVETRRGDELICPADGRVLLAEDLGGVAGNTVVIEHGAGVKSIFYGLRDIRVEKGDTVAQGQTIATTLTRTVLEVRVGRVAVDPLTVLRNESDALSFH